MATNNYIDPDLNDPQDCSLTPHHLITKRNLKPVTKVSRCSGCNKRFKGSLKRRNCSMCGDVFCKQCTVYRRRLSRISASPDELFGILHNICCKCFNTEVVMGSQRDLMGEFRKCRREKIEADMAKAKEMLCDSAYSSSKRIAILKEIDRLMKGFVTNAGFFKSLSAEIIVPDWQKSANWVESSNARKCYQCKETFAFFSLNSKNHCRIGGQVFCAQCIKDDLVIYLEDKEGKPKWKINGKDDGQNRKPVRFEIYKICSSCSSDLETILTENMAMSRQESTFMDDVSEMQQSISKMQANVEKWLPKYQQEVETIHLGMKSVKDTKGELARLHLNLTDTLSAINDKSDHLLQLHQQPESHIKEQEQKLLKNVLRGTQSSHQKHMDQFHCTKKQLIKHLSTDDQREIQRKSSREIMLWLYANISKLITDLEDYTKCYNFDGVFLEDARKIELSITEELVPWPERMSMEQHFRAVKDKPSGIDVYQMVKTSANIDGVKYIVVSQCSTIMLEYSSQLEAETLDLDFEKTKKSLKHAQERLEKAARTLLSHA